jgi:HPt (histidine-containing phosphotransfer) domain-containing protein
MVHHVKAALGKVSLSVCDLEAALKALEGDRELLARMIRIFLMESPALLEETREAVAREDGRALERSAHTLRGGVANFAATSAYAAATRLESIGQAGDWMAAAAAQAQLETEMEKLVDVLVGFGPVGPR